MKIVMGLGNPGSEYAHNRHNIGFQCLDRLSELHSIPIKKTLCQSLTGPGLIESQQVLLAKPKTFVNLSGKAASCLLRRYKCKISDLIVVHDDLDLPVGRMRVRMGGKSGGHRGIASIIACTGSEDFIRVRIGISHPTHSQCLSYGEAIVDYVLGKPTYEEKELIASTIEAACEAIAMLLKDGLEATMNRFNKRT